MTRTTNPTLISVLATSKEVSSKLPLLLKAATRLACLRRRTLEPSVAAWKDEQQAYIHTHA